MMHQPPCQMQYYPKTPLPQPSKVSGCNYQENNRNIENKPFIENFSNYLKSGSACASNNQCQTNKCVNNKCK
jgi:hypothetical protein